MVAVAMVSQTQKQAAMTAQVAVCFVAFLTGCMAMDQSSIQ